MLLHRWTIGLRAIAVFEIFKGALVLLAFVMIATGRWTMSALMERIVHFLHLNPTGHFGRFLTVTLAQIDPAMLVWLALAYIVLRFAEGYGLWLERHWGEWIAVLSAGLYVPAEIHEMWLHFSWRKTAVLGLNLLIIIFLGWVLWKTRRAKKSGGAKS